MHGLTKKHNWNENGCNYKQSDGNRVLLSLILANDCVLMLLLVVVSKGEDSRNHNINDARSLPVINVTLARGWLLKLLIIFQHPDLFLVVCFRWTVVNVVSFEKFSDNESVHPAEKDPKE